MLSNPLRYTDPTGHKTIAIDLGLGVMQIGALSGTFSLVFDDDGNIGLYFTATAGAGIGGEVDGGLGVTVTSADTIYDLPGRSVQYGGGGALFFGGEGSMAWFLDRQGNRQYAVSIGALFGGALKANASVGWTWELLSLSNAQIMRAVRRSLNSFRQALRKSLPSGGGGSSGFGGSYYGGGSSSILGGSYSNRIGACSFPGHCYRAISSPNIR